MDMSALLDANGAAIVLGGTLVATMLGSGRRELGATAASLGRMMTRPFDLERARAEIARDVEAIRHDGLLRSGPFHSSDRAIASVTDALLHDRSLASLLAAHERSRDARVRVRELACRPLLLAGEMAPVFGMAGTLLSLSQLQYDAEGHLALMTGVAMAIVTTLYGMLLAHLVFNPLARLIERRGRIEEDDRQLLIDWLARQVAEACPPSPLDTPRRGPPRLERVV